MFHFIGSRFWVFQSLLWRAAPGLLLCLYSVNLISAEIHLAWDPSPDGSLGGYRLYYGQTSGNYTSNIDVGNQTAYILTGLGDGQTYFFAVTAYNSTNTAESAFSNEVSITIPVSRGPEPEIVAVPALSDGARVLLIGLVFFVAMLGFILHRRG